MTSILVIGAGIGGIAAAARLAREGFQVTVVEKNEQPGGRCGFMNKDGYHFDTGATLFMMPELYTQTFTELGERMEDHLELQRVDPNYHLHFEGGSMLELTSDLNAMQTQLESIEPGSFGAYLRYLNEGYRNYKLSLNHILNRNFRNPFEFFTLKNLVLVFRLKALVNHYKDLGRYFDDPRLKVAFGFQNLYMGLNPFEAPAIYSLLQYTEHTDGIWFPKGGMYRIIEALTGIAEKNGVQFIYNAPVERIDIDEHRATGVTLVSGHKILADLVIANADLPYVYRHLLPEDGTADRLEHKEFGCSAIMFYWGLDKQYPQLAAHNLFIANNYRQGLDDIFERHSLSTNPSIYVHAPTRMDPSLAPDGHEILYVGIPCGNIDDTAPQNWPAIQHHSRSVVIQRLAEAGVHDLEDHLECEVSYNPHDWQKRYNLVKGSTHGLSHNIMQMGYMRPHNRHNRYHNLYFVGASTHPGTGLPTVLVSARLTSERILQEIGLPQVTQVGKPVTI
jgi:phytoene desaturase